MSRKSHVRLNTVNQSEPKIAMRFNYGPIGDKDNENEDEESKPKDYQYLAEGFSRAYRQFTVARQTRYNERNADFISLEHIDFIEILFQDIFNNRVSQSWYNEFGLQVVSFRQFNRQVLFAVVDQAKFQCFLNDIQNFIGVHTRENIQATYSNKITFIKDFKLFTTDLRLTFDQIAPLMNLRLVDFPARNAEAENIISALEVYFSDRGHAFEINEDQNLLEVIGLSPEEIEEVAKNFDIVLSVTSAFSTIVRPSEFNVAERTYGFEIQEPAEDLPIVGILDTGISNNSPLSKVLLTDDTFDLTNTGAFLDNADNGIGHGTSVGALVALGKSPYSSGYQGTFEAQARLLSMKILDACSGYLSSVNVLEMLYRAKQKYPQIKIFVLTTCYDNNKTTNEPHSVYAYELDKFSHQHDSLVFICTSNNERSLNQRNYDLSYFNNDETNLCSPAESLNNVIVGASADNLLSGQFHGISNGREFPTLFTRKCHVNQDLFQTFRGKPARSNKNIFRPDVIESAGDYEHFPHYIGTGNNASIQLLSANPAIGWYNGTGTSYSTPLVANIGAQIQHLYPELRSQTIKALIINSASLQSIRFEDHHSHLINKTAGHGIPNSERCIFSNDNEATIVIEDTIEPGDFLVIPINIPRYLIEDDLGKKTGLLKITATLCFSFHPVLNNQFAYCPVKMAFAFWRNHSPEEILTSNDEKNNGINSKLNHKGWSQDNRYHLGAPYNNTHKVVYNISYDDLVRDRLVVKLGVHCNISNQIIADAQYQIPHPFSIAIRVEENLPSRRLSGKLYDQLIAINETEILAQLDSDAIGELE